MDAELRPLGLAYTVVGSVVLSIGIGRIQGAGSEVMDWVEPALLIGLGLVCVQLGTRFGGMNWLLQFLLIGLMFLWGAFHAHDSFDRWFGFWMGGIFTLSAGVSIIGAMLTHGLRSALTRPSRGPIHRPTVDPN
jgi:hypothetical protein